MQFAELSTVKHRVRLGAPLPFNVRDADKTLLLARGQRVESVEQLGALFERGALVDLAELQTAREEINKAPRAQLPRLWARCFDRVSNTLMSQPERGYATALDDAAAPVQALIERDPDLAIFQVLRQGANMDTDYGAQRSIQCAITSFLVAQRLAWAQEDVERVFKVALTMNISMLELQGRLARQTTPLTAEQAAALHAHPDRSVRMLQAAGIIDADWLGAVLRHHEQEDGAGYPRGITEVGDLASLVRRADDYTAKLSARAGRQALSADIAGRQMFMQDPGHPMTAALVKEFGIYPPGSYVRLASGEVAVVVQRGELITAPVVAVLTDPEGHALPAPVRRPTTDRSRAVMAVVGEHTLSVRLTRERLLELLAA
jgi:HD-GYP domain-containing protein (c-di-GMP phosphodiesterase class II)